MAAGVVVLLVGVVATPVVPAGARPAAPAAACSGADRDGVTVMVDFGVLGGGVQIRCVTQPVTSGFDALKKAGFTYSTSTRFPGLLCRINGQPEDPCPNAPPSDRYWGYWTASSPGGAWTFSDLGAGNRTPSPGSVEGWAFDTGCDRKPGAALCSAPVTTTTRATPPPTGGPPATSGGPPPPSGSGTTTTDGPDGDGGTTTSAAAAAGVGSTTTTTTTTRDGERAPEAGEEGDAPALAADVSEAGSSGDGGSPVGAAVGIALVVALAAAGVARTRRRGAGEVPA